MLIPYKLPYLKLPANTLDQSFVRKTFALSIKR